MIILLFITGLVFLILGAEVLVRGASRLATAVGISPLIIGLTVVAFGTSSPELAVSIKAVLSGQYGISLGNIVGSNIFNVLFILGLSALITPLVVAQQLVRLELPLMLLLSVLVLVFGLDERFSRVEGLVLITGLAVYILFLFYQGRKENALVKAEYASEFSVDKEEDSKVLVNLALVTAGVILLMLGSRWLVDSTVSLARYFGISELVIGLTIIAAATSLPELVTSVIASLRGECDIAVGNIVGSNLFNILGVLGVASLVAPSGLEVPPAVIRFDIPIMIVVAFACLPIFFTGGVISRCEGGLLLGYYLAYAVYLVFAAAHHDALPWISVIMLYFAIPLTIFTLFTIAAREMYRNNKKQPG